MYLEQRAEEDTLFAKKYRNPAKNIDECVTHILNHVQKRDRKSTRLNSSHMPKSRMPSSA